VYIEIEQAFWNRVDKRGPEDCWPWTGSATRTGYGRLYHRGKTWVATRLSWQIANNADWPQGLIACHACDNPPCVNPAHIWPGSYRDNQMDSIAKGRRQPHIAGFPKGVASHWHKGQPSGHMGICRKCGHHRLDDYPEPYHGGVTWRCRACNLSRRAKRRGVPSKLLAKINAASSTNHRSE